MGSKLGRPCKPMTFPRSLTVRNHPDLAEKQVVNPNNEIGKVMLISRYGADKVDQCLPLHIDAVQASGHSVVWQCDAMVSLSGGHR